MPSIVDVILLKPYGCEIYYLVLDEMPRFAFERRADRLVAECDGFYECYRHERPTAYSKAFGGREFDILLKDGTVERAKGQWWWSGYPENEATGKIMSVGIATLETLAKCYVWSSGNIQKSKLDEWLSGHESSTDYEKYRQPKGC